MIEKKHYTYISFPDGKLIRYELYEPSDVFWEIFWWVTIVGGYISTVLFLAFEAGMMPFLNPVIQYMETFLRTIIGGLP